MTRSGCAAWTAWSAAFTLSYECGAAKPDARIFHAACRSLDLEPAHVLMVGDDPVADSGALAAGLADLVLVDAATPVTDERGLVARLDPARLGYATSRASGRAGRGSGSWPRAEWSHPATP